MEARAIATPATGPELAAFNYILGLDAMVRNRSTSTGYKRGAKMNVSAVLSPGGVAGAFAGVLWKSR